VVARSSGRTQRPTYFRPNLDGNGEVAAIGLVGYPGGGGRGGGDRDRGLSQSIAVGLAFAPVAMSDELHHHHHPAAAAPHAPAPRSSTWPGRRSRTLIPCLIVNGHAILPRSALFRSIGSCPPGFFSLLLFFFFFCVIQFSCRAVPVGTQPSRVAPPFVNA